MSEIIGTNHPEIQALLKENSFRVIKKAKTLARLPKESEIGKNFDTFVEKKGIIVKESDATITKNSVIARNPVPLSNGSFNEWPMDIETFQKNYGCKPTFEFKPYKKTITNNVIVIDDEILNILGSKDGKTAQLAISWDTNGMLVHKGDFLFDAGYAVDKREFNNTYEVI